MEQAQLERAKAAALEQKEVQMQQLEELKHRILGERCVCALCDTVAHARMAALRRHMGCNNHTVLPCCRAANKAEGELIRRKATEEAAELAAKEAAWRERAREMNAATKASNDTLLAFRAAERQREAQLEQAVEGARGWAQGAAPCCCCICVLLAACLPRSPPRLQPAPLQSSASARRSWMRSVQLSARQRRPKRRRTARCVCTHGIQQQPH